MVVLVVLLGAVAAVCLFMQWWVNRPQRSYEPPQLLVGMSGGSEAPVPTWREAQTVSQPVAVSVPKSDSAEQTVPLRVVRDDPFHNENEPVTTETTRFRRPVDEPVQLLPGCLEVVSGDSRHQEIRFVRLPGRPAELILGREPGDSPQHVAFRSSTVSRRHARLAFANGRWAVANLSQTNPVVVNDEELSARDGSRLLVDGDRLELGEVLLRFHAH